MVEYRCVTFREYPQKGLSGSRVRVMATEMFTGPASSRDCGDCVDVLAWPLVTVLSRAAVSFVRCFNVSFSETHKSKSLNRRRKVFQSFGKTKEKQGWAVRKCCRRSGAATPLRVVSPSAHRAPGRPSNEESVAFSFLRCRYCVEFQTLSHSKSKIWTLHWHDLLDKLSWNNSGKYVKEKKYITLTENHLASRRLEQE